MRAYEDLLKVAAEWEDEFARNKAAYGEKIHCRKGCTECCSQMFHITETEAAYISRAVRMLPREQRQHMEQRARQYLDDRKHLLASHEVPDAWGSLPEPGMRLPCPALENGACALYAHRPLICRKYGIPLYNPQKADRLFACELNFKPGEEIDVTQLVEIQTGIHQHWAKAQGDYDDRAGRRDPKPLTVARAILEDFESYPPPDPRPEPDSAGK